MKWSKVQRQIEMEKGNVLALPVKEDWLYVHASLGFALAQETQERLLCVSSTGFVCLFVFV